MPPREQPRFGTWEWNLDGALSLSDGAQALYGFAPGVYSGRFADFLGRLHGDDRETTLALMDEATRSGALSVEHRVGLGNGEVRWLRLHGGSTDVAGVAVTAMAGIAVDVTDRKRDEGALRGEQARFAALMDALPALIVTTTPGGEIEDISESYRAYTGLTLDEARDWSTHQVIHPDDFQQSMAVWGAAIEDGTAMQNEMRLRRHDGAYRWYLVQGRPVRDAAGAVLRWVTVSVDIEDRKRAEVHERYLSETTARLVTPIDSTAMLGEIARLAVPTLADVCAIGLFDHTAQTIRVETALADETERALIDGVHLRGWLASPGSNVTVGDLIGRGEAVYVPEFSPAWIDACAPGAEQHAAAVAADATSLVCVPMLVRGATTGMATFAYTHSRRRYTERDLRLLSEVAARLSIAIENLRLFAELKATAAALEEANAAKDEFLGLVSHELRTPITVILGNAQVLARRSRTLDDIERGAALDDIHVEAERLNRIIENLLVLARASGDGAPVERDTLALHRTVARIVEEHRKRYQHRAVTLTEPDGPLLAETNEFCVEQVLRNLLSNAEKYSPPGAPISVALARNGGDVVVSVEDRGSGIDPEDANSVFDPFYRAAKTSAVSGVGIGLTVCKRLVESQQGRIWIETSGSGGAVVRFTLPATLDDGDALAD